MSLAGWPVVAFREGVEFRWRKGLVFRTRRASTDDVLGRERPSFDVLGKSSGGICRCSMRVIRFEGTKRLWRRIIYHRGLGGERLR
jgi:hypothetical protein